MIFKNTKKINFRCLKNFVLVLAAFICIAQIFCSCTAQENKSEDYKNIELDNVTSLKNANQAILIVKDNDSAHLFLAQKNPDEQPFVSDYDDETDISKEQAEADSFLRNKDLDKDASIDQRTSESLDDQDDEDTANNDDNAVVDSQNSFHWSLVVNEKVCNPGFLDKVKFNSDYKLKAAFGFEKNNGFEVSYKKLDDNCVLDKDVASTNFGVIKEKNGSEGDYLELNKYQDEFKYGISAVDANGNLVLIGCESGTENSIKINSSALQKLLLNVNNKCKIIITDADKLYN